MHSVEKKFRKTCEKIAKKHVGSCSFRVLPIGFTLSMAGDSEMVPTIGLVNDDLVGSLDDFDAFLDLVGYESQIERVLFDPERARFILDAGWSGKYWRKPTEANVERREDFVVDTIGTRLPSKISVAVVMLIAAVERDSRFSLLKLLRKKR